LNGVEGAQPGTIAEGGEEDVSGTAIGTALSAGIVDVFSRRGSERGGIFGMTSRRQRGSARSARAGYGRRWLALAAAALVTGVYAAQVVVPAADTSPVPIAGIAPSYGPKTVSAVPNAAAIVRRIWLPGLDAGYDPQGLAVDGVAFASPHIAAKACASVTVGWAASQLLEAGISCGGARHLGSPPPK
jgi:hypothetical protein